MLTLKLALRTLARRKGRMALIGALVAFGTFLMVFGSTFASSAKAASKSAIIDHFTGDFILYSQASKDLPSPFAFNTPLPRIKDVEAVEKALDGSWTGRGLCALRAELRRSSRPSAEASAMTCPLFSTLSSPPRIKRVFGGAGKSENGFFGLAPGASAPEAPRQGIMISSYQNDQYRKNFGFSLDAGERRHPPRRHRGRGQHCLLAPRRDLPSRALLRASSTTSTSWTRARFSSLYDYSGVQSLPSSFDAGLARQLGRRRRDLRPGLRSRLSGPSTSPSSRARPCPGRQ